MRIGMITGEYPPMEGGVGAFTQELGQALQIQGHEVYILTTDIAGTTHINANYELHVDRHIQHWGWGVHRHMTQWIKSINPDVVNIQYEAAAYQMKGNINLYPYLQRRRISIPVVATYHDLLPPYLFPKAGPLRDWTVRQLARTVDGIIVTNHPDYESLSQQLGAQLPPTRMIPIGSNIAPHPPKGYTPRQWRAEHGFSNEDMLIGFFGFLNRTKGIETLVEAAAKMAQLGMPVQLLFIGGRTGTSDVTNTRYADEIDALIARLGITERVHRTGFTSPEEVSAAMLAIDICALPYREGASLRHGTLHAALAHGNAIVTTNPQTPIPQMRDSEQVLLIPPEDTAALVNAVQTLWTDTALRQRLSEAATTLAQEFSWDHIAAQTAQFFDTLRTSDL